MKKYYSVYQMILILVLLRATVYSFVEYRNEIDFNATLQLVEVKVKEKFCDAERLIKRKGRPNSEASILILYKGNDYWISYDRKDCEQIEDKVKLYYSVKQDEFYKSPASNISKTGFFAILALISLTPLRLLSTKMDKKSKKKKK